MSSGDVPVEGVFTLHSRFTVTDTVDRLKAAFAARGVKLFVHIDQKAEAHAVGLDQPQVHLLIVGNPRVGTLIMQAIPLAGLDLPLKVLVWESGEGQVRVSCNEANYLAARVGLRSELVEGLRAFETLVAATVNAA